MNELKVFNNETLGVIRVLEKNGEPWFVGRDVATVLGYKDTSDAMKKHVDNEDFMVGVLPTVKGNRDTKLINESGLYSLIMSSKLPSAKQFKKWVTNEVLPSIRKHGGYVNNEDMFIDTYLPYADENTKMMFKATLTTISNQNKDIARMKPKEEIFDRFIETKGLINVGDMANLLCQSGYKTGRNRLFKQMRKDGLVQKGNTKPMHFMIERGYVEIRERKDNRGVTTQVMMFTNKGQDYMFKKYVNKEEK